MFFKKIFKKIVFILNVFLFFTNVLIFFFLERKYRRYSYSDDDLDNIQRFVITTGRPRVKLEKSCMVHSNVNLKFIQGQRGKSLLLFDGFTFAKNNVVGDTVYWCCRARKIGKPACHARITTAQQPNGLYKVVVTKPSHNHVPTVRMLKKLEKSTYF